GVLLDPSQRFDQIKLANISGLRKALVTEVGQIKITEGVNAMIDCHHHHIASLAQVHTISGCASAGAVGVPPPVNVTNAGAIRLIPKTWRPDIQKQAVFTDRPTGPGLRRPVSILGRIANAFPFRHVQCGLEASGPSVGTIGNTLETMNTRKGLAAY